MMSAHTHTTPVVVVGSGLAGMTAATFLARAGLHVQLCEKASAVGGRARSETRHGFHFNLGPHALYGAGHGTHVLKDLGMAFSGGMPSQAGGYVIDRGVKHTLPAWVQTAIPVQVACSDVALQRLPQRHGRVAFGIDCPLYFSVHSAVAKLTPAGGVLIHSITVLVGPCATMTASGTPPTRVPIIGPQKIVRLYMHLVRLLGDGPRAEMRLCNGLAALVTENATTGSGSAPRFVTSCDLDAAGRIRRTYVVLTSRKSTAVG